MKKFLLFLFTPIIELLLISKKHKIAKYKLQQLMLQLEQLEKMTSNSNTYTTVEQFENRKNCLALKFLSFLCMITSVASIYFLVKHNIFLMSSFIISTICLSLMGYYIAIKKDINYILEQIKLTQKHIDNLKISNEYGENL